MSSPSRATLFQNPPGLPACPDVGAKVQIAGEQGTFLVVRVDRRRYLADLMRIGEFPTLEQGIHFALIHVLPEVRVFRPRNWEIAR